MNEEQDYRSTGIPTGTEVADMIKKFENTYQIVEMLRYFEKQHNLAGKALEEAGEGHRHKSINTQTLDVIQIKNYIYEKEGLKL